jgi:hypothetical protein
MGVGTKTEHTKGHIGLKYPLLISLAVVFTLALTFATLELPRILHSILVVYFPNIFWDHKSHEALLTYARPIGYACLALVIALIIVGFKTGKKRLLSSGSFAFFRLFRSLHVLPRRYRHLESPMVALF